VKREGVPKRGLSGGGVSMKKEKIREGERGGGFNLHPRWGGGVCEGKVLARKNKEKGGQGQESHKNPVS